MKEEKKIEENFETGRRRILKTKLDYVKNSNLGDITTCTKLLQHFTKNILLQYDKKNSATLQKKTATLLERKFIMIMVKNGNLQLLTLLLFRARVVVISKL